MLGRESMDALYEQVPAFERYFRIRVQRAFITEQQRISSSLSKTAEERYIEFLQHYPKLEQRVPQVQVASYLGITPEFLSTIRGRMARRNRS
jgi:CRP-like cAMP-binding protein